MLDEDRSSPTTSLTIFEKNNLTDLHQSVGNKSRGVDGLSDEKPLASKQHTHSDRHHLSGKDNTYTYRHIGIFWQYISVCDRIIFKLRG